LKYPVPSYGQLKMLLMKVKLFLFSLFATVSFISCGQAPDQPANPSPANQGSANSINPTLCATVSDPNGGTLQVKYFGRVRTAATSNKFTIVLLPDTQYYTEEPQGNHGGNIAMLNAQTTWIANNRASKNIVYVGHLGDCVQNGDNPPGSNKEIEWQRAQPAMATIESPALTGLPQGIPFGVCVGNHDQTPNGSATGTTNYYNQYFGSNHFNGRTYYGGHYASNNDNHYQLFSAGGIDFLVLSLEYDQSGSFATNGVLDWAANLVQTYNTRKVIVMTHYGINEDMTFSPQGQAIYDRLKVYPNFGLLVCGHRHTVDGEARRTDIYNGNTVHTMLSDYQEREAGGNGRLRILEFDPPHSKISVKTYSPYTNTYETDDDSQFDLSFNMLPLIGQVNNAASGSIPCFTWSNLSFSTNYEWDMELYDGQNVTIGPVWSFTTPAGAALPVTLSNFSAGVVNRKVKLNWRTANELNNDHFEIERSRDGISFHKIGEVPGRVNTTAEQQYVYYDEQPPPGKVFYRLKQVDRDSRSAYSVIRWVLFDDTRTFVAYPNPATTREVITIYFKNEIRGPVNITIRDMSGREMFAATENNVQNSFSIDPGLAEGSYILMLAGKDLHASQKIIVVNKKL